MTQTATADLIGRLEDRIVDLERRLAQYEKPNKTAPAASPYRDGNVTISTIKYPVVLPTADELRRLEEIAMRKYPKLRAGSGPASFKAAFFRLSYTCRAEKLDTKRSLDWWVDQCEDWLKAQGYYPTRPRYAIFRRRGDRNGGHRIFAPESVPEHEPRHHRSAAIRSLAGALARGAGERTSARANWYAEVKDWHVEAVPSPRRKPSTACTAAFGKSCRGSRHAAAANF
jgi:hypothetical protein